MLSLLSKLMKNFVNEVKFLINFFYVEYKLFVLRYHLSTNIKMHRVTFGAFLCSNKGREPEGFAMKPLKTFSFLGTPYLRFA